MQIIGGRYKGLKLKMPKGIRPTSGLVRESIFNVIEEDIIDATVLDLFSGSGAVGFEALSRGAKNVTFVEKSRRVLKVLKENLKKVGTSDVCVLNIDAMKFAPCGLYDIIIADPPYDRGFVQKLPQRFHRYAKMVIIEHSIREKLDIGGTRRYGDTLVTYIVGANSK
ncbi:16S rRNA (guanine(966)-N(2))-methyltransferase RsmD [candidate division WOR-3 bacterium]|nr:16S rRNA (guanine(966)-N(2))-methyltransferase RsmD [candidate division WOR-3 bacterium]